MEKKRLIDFLLTCDKEPRQIRAFIKFLLKEDLYTRFFNNLVIDGTLESRISVCGRLCINLLHLLYWVDTLEGHDFWVGSFQKWQAYFEEEMKRINRI